MIVKCSFFKYMYLFNFVLKVMDVDLENNSFLYEMRCVFKKLFLCFI